MVLNSGDASAPRDAKGVLSESAGQADLYTFLDDESEVMPQAFSASERAAVYRAIVERRDMRHFCGGRVSDAIQRRLLFAVHHAPSVGFMQPWRIIRVLDSGLRQRLYECVEAERLRTAEALGQRGEAFLRLKVEGVREAALLWVVVMPEGREHHIFGRRTLPEMDIASVGCAMQNLWLAARAEGLGMGWVSLFDPEEVRQILGCPAQSRPVAILCLGPVEAFYVQPMLQERGWAKRLPLSSVVSDNVWNGACQLWSDERA